MNKKDLKKYLPDDYVVKDLDINKLLDALDDDVNDTIIKLTKSKIMKYKNDVLQQLQLSREELKKHHTMLKEYRYINDISEINYGSYVRWIPLNNENDILLRLGGFITDIKLLENGLMLRIKIVKGKQYIRFVNIMFDENLIFQKLSQHEKIILNVLSYLEK